MVIKKNENIVARKVHGSSFLIDISDNYSEINVRFMKLTKPVCLYGTISTELEV